MSPSPAASGRPGRASARQHDRVSMESSRFGKSQPATPPCPDARRRWPARPGFSAGRRRSLPGSLPARSAETCVRRSAVSAAPPAGTPPTPAAARKATTAVPVRSPIRRRSNTACRSAERQRKYASRELRNTSLGQPRAKAYTTTGGPGDEMLPRASRSTGRPAARRPDVPETAPVPAPGTTAQTPA